MALPASPNTITAALINVELGRAAGAAFDINGAAERALAGVASGQISFSDFHGKSAYTALACAVSPTFAGGSYTNNTGPISLGFTGSHTGGAGIIAYSWSITGTGLSITSGAGTPSVIVSASNGSDVFRNGTLTLHVFDGTSEDFAAATISVQYGTPP